MLHLLGFDHEKFSYPHQGALHRLSNITKPGTKVVKELLA
jgi:ssRNA-specific RNase YbeY (16S rRNA maturation enzyme)